MIVPSIGVKEKENDSYVYLDKHQIKTINRTLKLWSEYQKERKLVEKHGP